MNDGGWTEANVVAAAVRILGGAQKVADSLGVSRSQVYRWIKARSMARATYIYVAKLASLSGIETGFLGGDASLIGSAVNRESNGKSPVRSVKFKSARSPMTNRTQPIRGGAETILADTKGSLGNRMNWQEIADRHACAEESARIEVQKGGAQQSYSMENNGVASSRGDQFGRKKSQRTKRQEESREHQP
jgi:hypothetical protein